MLMIAMASQISAIMKTWPTMAPFWPVTIAVAPPRAHRDQGEEGGHPGRLRCWFRRRGCRRCRRLISGGTLLVLVSWAATAVAPTSTSASWWLPMWARYIVPREGYKYGHLR